MRIDYQFENMTLLFRERISLRKVQFFRSMDPNSVYHFQILYHAGFLDYDRGSDRDGFGARIKLKTVHVTDKCLRYFAWRRNRILGSVLLPIFVSIATTTILYMSQHWLLPTLISLLCNPR